MSEETLKLIRDALLAAKNAEEILIAAGSPSLLHGKYYSALIALESLNPSEISGDLPSRQYFAEALTRLCAIRQEIAGEIDGGEECRGRDSQLTGWCNELDKAISSITVSAPRQEAQPAGETSLPSDYELVNLMLKGARLSDNKLVNRRNMHGALKALGPYIKSIERECSEIRLPEECERTTLEHLYDYVKGKNLDDGKYIERAVHNLLQHAREPKRECSKIPVIDTDDLEENIKLAENQLSALCQSGGRKWSLSIPPQSYDTDIVYNKMILAAKALLALQREPTRELVNGWQPIQTAPKNEDIWLFCQETDEQGVGYATQDRYTLACGSFFRNNGDYTDGGYGKDYKCNASHWMPLPNPPLSEIEDGQS